MARWRPPPAPATWRGWRTALAVSALLLAGMAASAAAFVAWHAARAPSVTSLRAAEAARPSTIVSADGEVLARFVRAQREPVTLQQVSPEVVKALLATEDHRFHHHHGVDVFRTFAAAAHTLGGDTQGGSTLTQQLARNLFPQDIGREQTLGRKVKEVVTALRIERHYTKEQILEAYLNSAPFLYNVVGIEMAARTYFDKPAAALDTLQAATLIGMLKGTAYYNPVRYPQRAQARRNVVLGQMTRRGVLDEARRRQLAAAPLAVQFTRPAEAQGPAPHFVAQVKKQLLDWADENDRDLYTDGLVIHTTLDSRLQAAAAEAVAAQTQGLQAVADVEWSRSALPATASSTDSYLRRARTADADPFGHFWQQQPALLREFVGASAEVKKAVAAGTPLAQAVQQRLADKRWLAELKRHHTRLEAGFVALDPASGAVRAWVGSRSFDDDQFDHVSQAARQPGSTFKPFVYAAALERGISSRATYIDSAVAIALGDGTQWKPTDMGGASELPMTLRDGLALSKNTITAQVAQEVGIGRVAELARAMGVDSKLDVVPSLALGTSPVTLLEMAGAYATLARQGEQRKPFLVQRIADRNGAVVAEFGTAPAGRALAAESAIELTDMLRDVVTRGTATALRSRFGITADVAGKTGTTQDNTDGWFIAMHPGLVAGAWVGFNDQRVAMRSNHWGQGGNNALLLVGDFMRTALKSGLIDAKAQFAKPLRSLPASVLPAEAAASATASESGWTYAETLPAGADDAGASAPRTAAEVERVVAAIERSAAESREAVLLTPSLRPAAAGQVLVAPTPAPAPVSAEPVDPAD